MLALKVFEAERRSWEEEREELQLSIRPLEERAKNAERERERLASELARSAAERRGSAISSSTAAEVDQLREQLEEERNRVAQMKAAAERKRQMWGEELAKISDQLAEKEVLEEKVAHLTLDMAKLRTELQEAAEREGALQRQNRAGQLEVQDAQRRTQCVEEQTGEKARELDILSQTVGNQLVAVERELQLQLQRNAEIMALFLQHSQPPLARIRKACQEVCASGDAGHDMWMRRAPPLFDLDHPDLQCKLAAVVDLLAYAGDTFDSRDRERGGSDLAARIEEQTENAKHWLKSVLA